MFDDDDLLLPADEFPDGYRVDNPLFENFEGRECSILKRFLDEQIAECRRVPDSDWRQRFTDEASEYFGDACAELISTPAGARLAILVARGLRLMSAPRVVADVQLRAARLKGGQARKVKRGAAVKDRNAAIRKRAQALPDALGGAAAKARVLSGRFERDRWSINGGTPLTPRQLRRIITE